MSQAKESSKSHTELQRYTLNELGIGGWRLSDPGALSAEVAESFAIVSIETSQSKSDVSEGTAPVTTAKESASDVLKRLSGDLSKEQPIKKERAVPERQAQPEASPEPEKLDKWLVQCAAKPLQSDIELALNALQIPYVTRAYDKPVQYSGVISDNAELAKAAEQVFSEQALKSSKSKKQLWQHLLQAQKSPS